MWRVVFLVVFLVAIAGSAFWYFRVPESYFLWNQLGQEKIATIINPNDPDLFLEIGNSSFGHGEKYDIKKAEVAYVKAITLDPNFKEAHYQLGRIHFINGKFQSALAEMNVVLRIDPEFKKAYYMYGLINGYGGDLDAATWGFSEFIKRDDFNWAGYNDLAWIYFKKGDYQKTKETALEGLKHAERNPWLSNIYGVALLNLGEKEKAQEALQVALEESEKMSPADWGIAYPGNNPEIYATGLKETKDVIRYNLFLLRTDSGKQLSE